MNADRLISKLQGFMTRPEGDANEAYRFNIKMREITLPEKMERELRFDQREELIARTLWDALETMAEELTQNFEWITGWYTEGQSGGWLVLSTDDAVLVDGHYLRIDQEHQQGGPKDWSPLAFRPAQKRLEDLQAIDAQVQREKHMLLSEMKAPAFWGAEKYWKRG